MSETVWVELIRTLPTLAWLAFAVAVLLIARRLLTSESHRIDKVETPFVSVSFAQVAMEEARRAAAEPPALPAFEPQDEGASSDAAEPNADED